MRNDPGILVVGESLIDIVQRHDGRIDRSPGGSPANVALTLGRLGYRPTLLTNLGADDGGTLISEWLAASNVEVEAVGPSRTATATATLDGSGSATYEFDIEWSFGKPPHTTSRETGLVHTGSIAAISEPGASAVREMVSGLRRTALVTYDPNMRPALISDRSGSRARVESFVSIADIVKASDEDLRWLYPDREPLESARSWQRHGPAMIVVTFGADGAAAATSTGVTTIAAPSVHVVDTVGAGDTFMGAMIDGLMGAGFTSSLARAALRDVSTQSVRDILEYAARAAAITVSRQGADPPRRFELEPSIARQG